MKTSNTVTPDRWLVLKIEDYYKVFATFLGGYTDGDAWKLNSGISSVEQDGDFYLFHGYSGSIYKCHKSHYGASTWTTGVLEQIMENAKTKNNITVEILDSNIDFLKIID